MLNKMRHRFVAKIIAQDARLKGFIARRVANKGDIEDVYQDTLTKILASQSEIRDDKPLSYAFKVAQNTITDRYKARRVDVTEIDDNLADDGPILEDQIAFKHKWDVFLAALKTLPELKREVFIRRRVQGQTRTEIAKALGISVKSVEKHMASALVKVTLYMDQAGFGDNDE
ncbi:RNA polymerase sigma factor [Woodsholea maritima]|uniref:RNA polymerase sigma factor n=1 Tax=Woodsholea maritima TaxID=240237 RepID=UPI00036D893A|nr:RNA polymerase sigma factor [Woodsholea maritima]